MLWCTGVAQADADAGLAQDWPRETDASPKDAQVGKPGMCGGRHARAVAVSAPDQFGSN